MSGPRPLDLWLMDQLEAVAVAIAMALVLKFFVIEAYQIPTGSMQPTILGDAPSGIRDRVLADKLCTLLRDPRRWEVMIFRFPHDERRLYVKRIVGLPGETLEIRGGDLWVDGRIARKPDQVNDSVLKQVFPVEGGLRLDQVFSPGPGVALQGAGATFSPDATGELRLRSSVRAEYLHGYDPDWGIDAQAGGHEAVADLELSATVQLDSDQGALELGFVSDEGELRCRVRAAPAHGEPAQPPVSVSFGPEPGGGATDGGAERALHVAQPAGVSGLPVGKPCRVVARYVDRELLLLVDGKPWLRLDDDTSGPRADRPVKALAWLAVRGGGSAQELRLRRDIFYTQRLGPSRWEIPPDCYFGLGDNTQGSYDSRGWELHTYRVRDPSAPGGARDVTGFWLPGPSDDSNPRRLDGNRLAFADIHGDEAVFSRDDVLSERSEPAPFIPRRDLLGKAIAVFWPVWRPFRWKLIR